MQAFRALARHLRLYHSSRYINQYGVAREVRDSAFNQVYESWKRYRNYIITVSCKKLCLPIIHGDIMNMPYCWFKNSHYKDKIFIRGTPMPGKTVFIMGDVPAHRLQLPLRYALRHSVYPWYKLKRRIENNISDVFLFMYPNISCDQMKSFHILFNRNSPRPCLMKVIVFTHNVHWKINLYSNWLENIGGKWHLEHILAPMTKWDIIK